MTTTMTSYRHKKFDLRKERREDIEIKAELIARHRQEEEDTSSQCSSDYSLPLLKRRRLNSTIGNMSTDSDSASSTHSLPKSISPEALREICKYHGNMVRTFPKKERTPKEQERRNKNTIACRMSRRVKKLEHLALQEQYKELSEKHFKIIEQSIRTNAYLQHLNQLIKPDQAKNQPAAPAPQKNFSIDYLMNGIKRENCNTPNLSVINQA